MQFGTPEQDAFRRDFTINSLFYNINNGVIEDFTGRGIEDMKEGIIRTPLPAKETFLDGMMLNQSSADRMDYRYVINTKFKYICPLQIR